MRTVCIYHSRDLDGWMSAAIVKLWFEKIYDKGDALGFIGWDYGDAIPNLGGYEHVIMCDVSFPPDIMLKIQMQTASFIWLDHHKSSIEKIREAFKKAGLAVSQLNGMLDTKFSACELTWMHFFTRFSSVSPFIGMPEIVRLIGRWDCFQHRGTDEEEKIENFQYGARVYIDSFQKAYKELKTAIDVPTLINTYISVGKTIRKHLFVEAKEIFKRSFPIKLFVPEKDNGELKTFLCVNAPRFNPDNYGIDYHKNGVVGFVSFFYNKGRWDCSIYNADGSVDVSVVARSLGGGGHTGAAGFLLNDINILFDNLENIKRKINE
jgi:oligoribonuclease NrnB/cAMP/cGMP phosphodiesterase (DHH superfamily)